MDPLGADAAGTDRPNLPCRHRPIKHMSTLGALQDTQAELERTRAFVGAARLRSVLRSRRALALTRAWTAWTRSTLISFHAAKVEPLFREVEVLRAETAAVRERGNSLHELKTQFLAARESDERLHRETAEAHEALMQQLASAQHALAASQAEASALREEEARLRNELGGTAVTLRDGFHEAAAQGARLAADEHSKQLIKARF